MIYKILNLKSLSLGIGRVFSLQSTMLLFLMHFLYKFSNL